MFFTWKFGNKLGCVYFSIVRQKQNVYNIVRENPQGKEMIAMTMTKVEIDVPEEIVPYTVLEDKDAQITRNAMLVYPYIKSGVMSHGKAAEMLGLHKIDLITLYGKLGLPYFDETEEEFEEDLAVLKKLRGATV